MRSINVLDIEAEDLEKIADDNDLMVYEVVEMLMDYVDQLKRDNNLI